MGADPIMTVQVACLHAARYFLLNNRGAIAPGYLADFAIVEDLKDFHVVTVYKRGKRVYHDGIVEDFPLPRDPGTPEQARPRHLPSSGAFSRGLCQHPSAGRHRHGAGADHHRGRGIRRRCGRTKDVLKMAVVERHKNTRHIGIGYLKGYGLKSGAVATSVAHDSHNIICVGTNDEDMAFAVNRIARNRGGIVVVENGQVLAELPLEIAGIISGKPLAGGQHPSGRRQEGRPRSGRRHGHRPVHDAVLHEPAVIPTLRLTTRGVVDVNTQQYV